MHLFKLPFFNHKNVLPRMLLEVFALCPFVVGAGKKLLFEVADRVNSVKVREKLRVYMLFANFALSNPDEPLLAIVALEELHPEEFVSALGAEINFLQSELSTVVLVDFYSFDIAELVDFDVREDALLGVDFPSLDLLDKLVKLTLARLDFFRISLLVNHFFL